MLTVDLEGVQSLLTLLQYTRDGHQISNVLFEKIVVTNAFFVDYYSQWDGVDRDSIEHMLRHFNQPEQIHSGAPLTRLAEGLRQAMRELPLMRRRLSWLREIDVSGLAERVLAFLPEGTPVDSVVHITIDRFNSGFVYQGEMGMSLLTGAADQQTFEAVTAHELHHIGFRYWNERDAVQQMVLREKSGRSVAVEHIRNLLMEGLANTYLTPDYVFRESPGLDSDDPYEARLARLQREEEAFLTQAEAVLAKSLAPGADYASCWDLFMTIACDMEDYMLPAGHYLGARLVQVMAQIHPQDLIIGCIQNLPSFLPLYNEAARASDGFTFDPQLVSQFARIWENS